ncbi:PKHD-type hydroxylase YbiX [Raoultella ornithinolytica]|jgi:PKHD-type hydroxylase|uniref:PKHD-type hydroxylase n=1 Tax=Raoultella ornithinolytica TaxID=54291 RepID=A0A1Y6GKB6_RAOOR|nr:MULTISPECIES: PKHD-type hydroxylase YbiX [Raoultella]HDX8330351.1 PKHD-type hydroxylase YbiX [Raoultella ornithinolytica CD1_MRS_4]AGJ86892.1 Fe(II)-dependent oxygenase superfamily protein [Raoultella ornithinolytica B6]ANZ05167.1 Fe(II)-dependent oxygenase [Raoultella ornithinolytica]AOO56821.1 Fe(II)-dependent oxygenase [Raoultella ornithinolytica]APB05056.1 Fe2+-dependent dioxygenase [Raoultella ornithinolytica]
MMYHIPAVLSPQEVDDFRAQLQQADWVDGRATTGDQGALVKKNQQVDTRSPLYGELQNRVLAALNRSSLFFAAALPKTLSSPLFNRYQQSETYGFHVDGAVRSQAQGGWMRTDLSATLFLSAPESYDGGELVVNDTYGQHTVKLPAGDLVLYPSSSLHCVMPVTQGVRVASFLWIQSMIRDDKRRSMLFELDRNIQTLKSRHGESDEVLSLLNLYHNLLREWSEI